MIEEYLLQYGVLGLWTLSLIFDKAKFQKEIKTLIASNTKVLNKLLRKIK